MCSLEIHEQWFGRHTEQSIKSEFQSRLNLRKQSKQNSSIRDHRSGRGYDGFRRGGVVIYVRELLTLKKDCWFKKKL